LDTPENHRILSFYTLSAKNGPSRNSSKAAVRYNVLAVGILAFSPARTAIAYSDSLSESPLNELINYLELLCFMIINMRTGEAVE
jgi:hypothetical protein